MVRIGDIFDMPLKDGRKAYGQYVYKDKKQGPLIQVFDVMKTNTIFDIETIKNAKPLFSPVITGLFVAIREGLWHVVGRIPINGFAYPNFVSAYYDYRTGNAYKWFLWDGEKYISIGNKLPEKYKKCEYLVVWSPYDVISRIETGKYPYPYGDLILHNKFIPRK